MIKLIPKGQNAFANGIQYIGDKIWGGTKWIAHKINEHGNQSSYTPSYNTIGFIYQDIKRVHPEYSDKQIQSKIKEIHKKATKNAPSRAEKAAAMALFGEAVGWFGDPYTKAASTVASGIDQVYDWAAAIDEPKPSNFAHVGTNYLEKIAEVIPGKADDYVAKGLNLIGNADDATSAQGSNLFGWMDGEHGKINNTSNKESAALSTYVQKHKVYSNLTKKSKSNKKQ